MVNIIYYKNGELYNKNILLISPNGGFGNRIRAVCGACIMAEKMDMQIAHCWDGSNYICAFPHIQKIHNRGFSYFFKDIIPEFDKINSYNINNSINLNKIIDKCYTEWLPDSIWYHKQNYGQTRYHITNIDIQENIPKIISNESFIIETTINLSNATKDEIHKTYMKYFIPNDRFTEYMQKETITNGLNGSNGSNGSIGISIRLGEFLSFFPNSKIDENILVNFIKEIDNPVILFSDDHGFRNMMRQYIKNPIILSFESDTTLSESEDIAFLEFLTLSKCNLIYGTDNSSFAEEAANFGGKEYRNFSSIKN